MDSNLFTSMGQNNNNNNNNI